MDGTSRAWIGENHRVRDPADKPPAKSSHGAADAACLRALSVRGLDSRDPIRGRNGVVVGHGHDFTGAEWQAEVAKRGQILVGMLHENHLAKGMGVALDHGRSLAIGAVDDHHLVGPGRVGLDGIQTAVEEPRPAGGTDEQRHRVWSLVYLRARPPGDWNLSHAGLDGSG